MIVLYNGRACTINELDPPTQCLDLRTLSCDQTFHVSVSHLASSAERFAPLLGLHLHIISLGLLSCLAEYLPQTLLLSHLTASGAWCS